MAAFDALTTAAIADELQNKLGGGRVQEVLQVDPLSLGLEVYAQRARHNLLLCYPSSVQKCSPESSRFTGTCL
jgi:predicted ribosome quality control (RQC) complex YloA/Tae2 family protein